MCRVSVIIPNYCHAAYLDQRIQSVLNQTYQDFEIIILDDNSPDNDASKNVIEKYRGNSHVSNIIYNESNSGSTFKQWAKGIELSKGDLIWIAESDDYCSPTFLEVLVKAIDGKENVVLAFCQSVWVNQYGHKIKKCDCNDSIQYFDTKCFVEWFMLLGNGVTNASSAIFRKKISLKIDNDYALYKGAGDRLFWIKIAEEGNTAFVNSGLNFFRQHGDNTTARCYVDGTNFIEDKRIFDYICRRYKVSMRNRLFVYLETLKFAKRIQFKNEQIKEEVFSQWSMPISLKLMKPICKLLDLIKSL